MQTNEIRLYNLVRLFEEANTSVDHLIEFLAETEEEQHNAKRLFKAILNSTEEDLKTNLLTYLDGIPDDFDYGETQQKRLYNLVRLFEEANTSVDHLIEFLAETEEEQHNAKRLFRAILNSTEEGLKTNLLIYLDYIPDDFDYGETQT